MPLSSIVIIVALVAYAVYRQTQRHEVVGSTRFKLAVIYGVVGLAIGGYHVPANATAVGFLLASLLLSAVVGVFRGRFTRVWNENGRVFARGTALSVGLFLGMVLVKVALGTVAYFTGVSDNGGIGEILLMIAIMVALQAEIVWRRARPLGARTSDRPARVGA